jgi:hypothetical protein
MPQKFHLLIQVSAMVLAVRAFPWAAALAEDPRSLTEQLRAQYKLAKTGFDSSGFVGVEPGVVLVIKKAGILGFPPNATMAVQVYKNGQLRGLNGYGLRAAAPITSLTKTALPISCLEQLSTIG